MLQCASVAPHSSENFRNKIQACRCLGSSRATLGKPNMKSLKGGTPAPFRSFTTSSRACLRSRSTSTGTALPRLPQVVKCTFFSACFLAFCVSVAYDSSSCSMIAEQFSKLATYALSISPARHGTPDKTSRETLTELATF